MTFEFNPSEHPHAFGYHFAVGLSSPILSREDKDTLRRIRPVCLLIQRHNFDLSKPYSERLARYKLLYSEAIKYTEQERVMLAITAPNDHLGWPLPEPCLPLPNLLEMQDGRMYEQREEIFRGSAEGIASLGIAAVFGPQLWTQKLIEKNLDRHLQILSLLRQTYQARHLLVGPQVLLEQHRLEGGAGTGYAAGMSIQTDADLGWVRRIYTGLLQSPTDLLTVSSIPTVGDGDNLPLCCSERLLSGLLRDELGYKGVLVGDDLESLAARSMFFAGPGVGWALKAGVDLMVSSRQGRVTGAHPLMLTQNLYNALRQGIVNEEQLYISAGRIQQLLAKSAATPPYTLSIDQQQSSTDLLSIFPQLPER